MERNTLVAIVLSAVVLFTYQSIFTPPKAQESLNNSQVLYNKEVKQINTPPDQTSSQKPTNQVIKTENYKIKTKFKDISFSNMGGVLHKVDFLENSPLPATDVLNINEFDDVQYSGKEKDDKTITLNYSDKTWQVTKTFQQVDDNFMSVRLEIKNISEISILENFTITAFKVDNSRMDINQSNREGALFEYSINSNNKIYRKGNAIKFNDKNYKKESAGLVWAGFRNHYYAFIVKPEFGTKGYEIKPDGDKELTVSLISEDKTFAPGESHIYNFSIYAGPQNPWIMKEYHKGFEKIVAFSNFAIIEWIGQGIYYAIPIIHKIFKSWGIAIIIISLFIYGITYPLTMQSMMSMRKMQEVQPKITALRERYKNDPQKLNAEMVEIYRREKINPFGGMFAIFDSNAFFYGFIPDIMESAVFSRAGLFVDQRPVTA